MTKPWSYLNVLVVVDDVVEVATAVEEGVGGEDGGKLGGLGLFHVLTGGRGHGGACRQPRVGGGAAATRQIQL